MLDVLFLLLVSRGLLETFNDEGGGSGDDFDLGLTVLDDELDGHLELNERVSESVSKVRSAGSPPSIPSSPG